MNSLLDKILNTLFLHDFCTSEYLKQLIVKTQYSSFFNNILEKFWSLQQFKGVYIPHSELIRHVRVTRLRNEIIINFLRLDQTISKPLYHKFKRFQNASLRKKNKLTCIYLLTNVYQLYNKYICFLWIACFLIASLLLNTILH